MSKINQHFIFLHFFMVNDKIAQGFENPVSP